MNTEYIILFVIISIVAVTAFGVALAAYEKEKEVDFLYQEPFRSDIPGNSSKPVYSFSGSPSTGMFLKDGSIQFSKNGTTSFIINEGNVEASNYNIKDVDDVGIRYNDGKLTLKNKTSELSLYNDSIDSNKKFTVDDIEATSINTTSITTTSMNTTSVDTSYVNLGNDNFNHYSVHDDHYVTFNGSFGSSNVTLQLTRIGRVVFVRMHSPDAPINIGTGVNVTGSGLQTFIRTRGNNDEDEDIPDPYQYSSNIGTYNPITITRSVDGIQQTEMYFTGLVFQIDPIFSSTDQTVTWNPFMFTYILSPSA